MSTEEIHFRQRYSTGTMAGSTPKNSSRELATDRILAVALGVVGLVAIEALVEAGIISEIVIPKSSAVFVALASGLTIPDGRFWPHIWSTLSITLLAFVIAAIVAITLATLMTVFPRLQRIVLPYVVALQSTPKIALAPIVFLWFGFGTPAKLGLAIIAAFFAIFVNGLHGLRLRDRQQYDLMQSLGASRLQIYRYVRFPSSLPFLFAGFHLGVVYSLLGVVVAEFVRGSSGVAYLMLAQRSIFNTAAVFALLLILSAMGVLLHQLAKFAEKRVVFWSKETSDVAI